MQSILNRINFHTNFKIFIISKRYLLNKQQINVIKSIVGSDNLSSAEAVRLHHSKDESFHRFLFQFRKIEIFQGLSIDFVNI